MAAVAGPIPAEAGIAARGMRSPRGTANRVIVVQAGSLAGNGFR